MQWCVVSGAFNTSNQVSIEVAGNASTLQVAYKVEVEMSCLNWAITSFSFLPYALWNPLS